jgi:REP element-mobilizing transposase RayT
MNDDPIAYFITWTCYGTWLPGDDRGWTKWHKGDQLPQPRLADWCREQMVEKPVLLSESQRKIVHDTVSRHCEIRKWHLHVVNCRSNHCHVVVTAPNYDGEQVRDQFKSWCKRKLKEDQRSKLPEGLRHAATNATSKRSDASPPVSRSNGAKFREHWWTRKGSVRHLFDDDSLDAAVIYTLDAQDKGGSKSNH